MDVVRVLHIRYYDPARGRFSRLAFKNSSGSGGISVFDASCALRESGDICPHIRRFYQGIAGIPPVYWRISRDALTRMGATVEDSPSSTGDHCHANILGISDNEARRFLISDAQVSRLRACADDDIAVTCETLAAWRRAADG